MLRLKRKEFGDAGRDCWATAEGPAHEFHKEQRQKYKATPGAESRQLRKINASGAPATNQALFVPIEHWIRHAHPATDSGFLIREDLRMRMSAKSIG